MRPRVPASKREAQKRPRPWTASQAERTLKGPGGIAGLLKTLATGWPEELTDFEEVFALVVDRCRTELRADRLLAYLCRALLHERAYQKIRRRHRKHPKNWALAAERVKLTAFEAFQAPSFANNVLLARGLSEAIHNPGPAYAPGKLKVLKGKQRKLMTAAGGRLLSPPKGSPQGPGVRRPRTPSKSRIGSGL